MSQRPARTPRSHILITRFVIVPLLLAATPAIAANRKAQERSARRACLNGDYTKGVAILSDLFVDTQDPTYIFNQGRCFEQNRRYEDATARFEEYLRAADAKLSPEDRAAAEKHIGDCRAKLLKEHGDSTLQPTLPPGFAPTPASPVAPERTLSPTLPEPRTSVADQTIPLPSPGDRRWGLVTAGIITGVVGVGGVAAGVIFNLKANSAAKDLETNVGAYPAKSNDEKDYRTSAWIGYGIGAACVATGAVLIAIGAVRASPKSSRDIAFVPAVGPSQVGAMLTGGF
jgi:hypothetical protein